MQWDIGKPNPRQIEFFKARARFIAYGGARGGGKSWAVRKKAAGLALSYPGAGILIVRRTFPELRENHILPMTADLAGIARYRETEMKRDLPQALAAQGLTGGMSESALAGMYNSYGNNRNTIDRGRNESLAALLDTLNSNRSSALQSYNSQLSAAEQQKMAYQMQLEQALANGSAEILQNKYDTLQNLDNAYAQQILALQQAAAQAAQKRW